MRLHRNLVFPIINGLQLIFNEGQYADKVVSQLLKSDKRWGSRDRGFLAETLYEIVRWKRLYSTIAEVNEPFNHKDLWRVFGVWATLRGIPLPDWKQLEGTPTRRIKGKFDVLIKERAIRESIPDWLDHLGLNTFGQKKWEKELTALNTQAPLIIRVNRLKTLPDLLKRQLLDLDISSQQNHNYNDALILHERTNVFSLDLFQKGHFEVQDANSQLVAPFVEAEKGMRVVDACAGAGGKSLHLAALMKNKGQLIAMDIYQNKLHELKRRARRAGAHNIETKLIENSKTIKKLSEKADRVLIDAPCTGLGVLRRNPDAKWKLDDFFLKQVIQKQTEILNNYSKMAKIGGKVIYATCSILPQENEQQVQKFLTSDFGKSFDLEKQIQLSPEISGFDGFYMARLVRK